MLLCFNSLADSLFLYFMHALCALKFSDSHRHSPSALLRVPGFRLMSFRAALEMDLLRSSFVAFERLLIPYMKSGDFLSISIFCDSSRCLSSAAVSSLSFFIVFFYLSCYFLWVSFLLDFLPYHWS